MSSRVLALKYRPQTFDDVVGQATTVRILGNILGEGKGHHAYLLTGPRGVGKTSLARIFAKNLNCEKGPTAKPCGKCGSCTEITAGRSLSVLEIDGASNTSVDDVRDLREKIRYLPPGGRYKIYIIDEVHMLSNAAFNALLKTLEEPPPHALFIFATTEPQKVPITVVSRCLRFDLRPISINDIVGRLKEIAKKESITCEDAAIYEMARQSLGGLRDALGLLDQAAAFSNGKVTLKVIEEILGSSPRRFLVKIIKAIFDRDSKKVLSELQGISKAGIDTKRFVLELLETFRHLLVVRVSQEPDLFDLPADEVAQLQKISEGISPSSLDQVFQMLQKGMPDLLRSPSPQVLLDVLLLRLCRYQELESIDSLLKGLESIASGGNLLAPRPVLSKMVSGTSHTKEEKAEKSQDESEKSWGGFIQSLNQRRPQLSSILDHSVSAKIEGETAVIAFAKGSIHLEMMKDKDRQSQLGDFLSTYFGKPLTIRLASGGEEVVAATKESNVVDDAVSIFNPQSLKTVPFS